MKIRFIEVNVNQTEIKTLSVGNGYSLLPRIDEMIIIEARTYRIINIVWDYNKDPIEMIVSLKNLEDTNKIKDRISATSIDDFRLKTIEEIKATVKNCNNLTDLMEEN